MFPYIAWRSGNACVPRTGGIPLPAAANATQPDEVVTNVGRCRDIDERRTAGPDGEAITLGANSAKGCTCSARSFAFNQEG